MTSATTAPRPRGRLLALLSIGALLILGIAAQGASAATLSFNGNSNVTTGAQPLDVAVADFDGDGIKDIASANSGDDSVSVPLGKGGGRFAPSTTYPGAQYTQGIAAGDLNNDGHPDLLTTTFMTNSVSVMMNTGGGRFGPTTSLDVGGPSYHALI